MPELPVIERFTERARLAIVLAAEMARQFQHDVVRPEHILLGLIRECETTAVRSYVFYWAPVFQIETVKTRVKRALDALPQMPTVGEMQFTTPAKHVLERAIGSGHNVGDDGSGIRHLLLGLLKEEHSSAAQILKDLRLPVLSGAAGTAHTLTFLGEIVGEFSRPDQVSPGSMPPPFTIDVQ